jgi:hypothetical protein
MYRGFLVGSLLILIGLAAAPARGQSKSEEMQKLQRQIQTLQDALSRLEISSQEKARVIPLGSNRMPVEEKEDVLVVRIYDLSDLFVVAPPYPAASPDNSGGQSLIFPNAFSELSGMMGMGGMGGMGGGMKARGAGSAGGSGGSSHGPKHGGQGMFNIAQPPVSPGHLPSRILPQMLSTESDSGSPDVARMSIDELVDAITKTISPSDWSEYGGRCSIASLGNTLIVSATKNIHAQIESLFTAFRKRWGTFRTVSVEAHWLWLTEEQLDRLLDDSRQRSGGSGEKIFGLVDETPWKELRDQLARAGDDQPAGYQSVLTGFNGQTVSTVSGGVKRFVIDMIPVVGQNMSSPPSAPSTQSVGYQPVTASIQEGAALQVTPMVSTGGKYVTLDVHSRVLRVQETKTPPLAAVSSVIRDLAAVVDRPQMDNSLLATTLRIPAGSRMLVGGMTFESVPQSGQPNLYLFVKVQVQELRDDAAEKPSSAGNR